MSNNLVTQPLSIPNNPMGQLEPISSKLESSIPNMLMGPMGQAPNNVALQPLPVSNEQMEPLELMSNNHGPQKLSITNKQMGQMEHKSGNLGPKQLSITNKELGGMEAMLNFPGSQQLSILNKRKAPMEPISSNPMPQRVSVPNKRVAQMEHRPWLLQSSTPNKKTIQMQLLSNVPGSPHSPAPNKRVVQLDSIPTKPGPQQLMIPKNQTAQMQPSPKVQSESFGSVRSKLRESLAAALALVTQQQDKPSKLGNNSQSKAAITLGQTQENSQHAAELTSTTVDAADNVAEKPIEVLSSNEDCSAQKHNDGQTASQETSANDNIGDSTQMWKGNGQEFQSNAVLLDEDVSLSDNFFVKDELLQGNGLSWALDADVEVAKKREIQTSREQKLDREEVHADWGEQPVQSPQNLASKIEAELFKLFGGVNKKYKEKGRSLLFNLKDRNNPALRERVMSGEILPERLCSMTAEELASEELSQWRIAKAEEFAQMVVLPDSEVDIRRLVRKTHKGEFQVEVEQDDSVSVEVSIGASSLTNIQSKANETEAHPPSKPDGMKHEVNPIDEKSNLEGQDLECTLTIPSSEGTDLMQGLMVDELKDAEFLPPIVSLDEFMESLDSEPPFEILPVDAGKTTPISDDNSEVGSESKSSDLSPKDPVDTTPDKSHNIDVKDEKSDASVKSSDSHIQSKASKASPLIQSKASPVDASKGEHVWEGLLHLNLSAVAMVSAFFRSGEKTPTKEWPSFLEIKGRVRLDAFEKFLQELRLSRSRAIMVVHFVRKQGSPESESASLSEVADSYVVDERVGFAEPAPGVELYFCPPHARTLEMLGRHLPKDHTEALNTSDNGLIGVVIWRKAQLTSTISPNSSSHHKHSSKRQHFSSRRHQEKDANNFTSKPLGPPPSNPQPQTDDDDDIPPGFGPAAARDEDDLPEFKFSGGSNPSVRVPQFPSRNPSQGPGMAPFHPLSQTSSRPVEQMRELIHKYGQTGTSAASMKWQDKRGIRVAVEAWNDDDDDIPEWQPQAPQQQQLPPPPPQPPVHSFQQPMLLPHMVNQQHLQPQQSPHPYSNASSNVITHAFATYATSSISSGFLVGSIIWSSWSSSCSGE
ncbi:hypothetical protein L1049_018405 [Liquidambar formosana]|uniref:TFIIS central domain-containing protein n=1 Tax=Liquidambar formosana TaxID=63359 RepID=A0AAP0WN41_LIQFO